MLKKLAMLFGVIAVAALVINLPSYGTRAAAGIAISEANFPDEGLRSFLTGKFGDILDEDEIADTTYLYMRDLPYIRDITGLEKFTSLEELKILYSDLTNPDLKKLKKLKKLDLNDSNIESLDLSGMTSLTDLSLSYSHKCKIDLTNCTSLDYVHLYSYKNSEPTTLTLKGCSAVTRLETNGCNIEKLDLTDLKALKSLSCINDPLMTEIDLSQNKKLTFIDLSGCSLTGIDVSQNTLLETLFLTDNNIRSLTLECPELLRLQCGAETLHNNVLQALDISKCPKIERLTCRYCSIDKIYAPKSKDKLYDLDLTGTEAEWVVIIHREWTIVTSWTGDEKNGYTGATVRYRGTASGYGVIIIERDIDISSTKVISPTCDKKGYTVYNVNIPASKTPDGKEFSASTKGKYTDAKGHSWSKWTVSKKATSGTAGLEIRTCSSCKKQEKRNAVPLYVICGNNLSLNKVFDGTTRWNTSDKKIATVDSNGVVTGKSAGTVTITATCEGKSEQIKVTVLYKDVINPDDFWFTPTYALTDAGIVKGYDNQTSFRPSGVCTRAQIVTFLWRLKGQPEPKAKKCKFSDVKKTDYYYKACIWGNENHVVEGYKDGTFGPKIMCARRHAVTFLWRLAGKPEPETTKNKFNDIKSKDYYYKATLWASEKKILEGYDDGTFRPDGACLRRQMVTLLYKFDKYLNK